MTHPTVRLFLYMQFNSHSTSQDIVTMADKFVKTDVNSFPLIEKVLYANEGMRIIWSWIYQAYSGWIYDDKNNTDFPEATTSIVSGQKDYSLPTDSSGVYGVEVYVNGEWTKLDPITLEQIQDVDSENNFLEPDNIPRYYRLIANSIKLYPTPNFSSSNTLRVLFNRDISTFATTDTTKTPGFDTLYHEAVAVFTALRYAKINGLESSTRLQIDWDGDEDRTGRVGGYKARIKKDYSQRFKELFPPRMTVRDATQEYQ